MIITRTPLRISFVGGGTDFEGFYRKYPGRVLSTSIDKYVYVTLNPRFEGNIRVSYSKTENVDHWEQIEHPLVKAALEEVGIEKGIEITSIGDIPGRGTGLGSSSSFTVGLLNALYFFKREYIPPDVLAEKACHIEIDKAKSPIGKQDQYAVAFGGLNLITFNCDGKIEVEPIYLNPKTKEDFQNHLLLFYTGIQRSANSILSEQKQNIGKKFEFLQKMSDMVPIFKNILEKRDFQKMGEILNQGWLMKKELSSGISNPQIDKMYSLALKAGAWGGKVLGAGGGGFFLAVVPPEKQENVKEALNQYQITPIRFTEAGSKIVFKD